MLNEEAEAGSTTSGGTVSTDGAAPAAPALRQDDLDATGGDDTVVDWEKELGGGDEEDDVTSSAAPAAAAPQGEKPAAATPPVSEGKPAAGEPPAATPAAQTPAATPQGEQPAPTPPAIPQGKKTPAAETPEQRTAREAADKQREEEQFNGLVEFYKIPDDMAAKLPTEPENVLPVLAARVHQSIARGVQTMLAQQLPEYISQTMEVQAAEERSKSAFYAKWPQLKQHEQQVLQAGQLYRAMNPAASADDAIQAIGEIVTKALGITVAAVPATPAAPAPAAPAPLRPAAVGGSRVVAPPAEENEFTQLALGDD